MKSFVTLSAALGLVASTAVARPPPNADMSLAPWFQSLQQPGTGMSCCSMADCRQTDFRILDGHYQAMIEGEWRVVPPEVVLQRTDNPTGRAVVCYSPYHGIMCFIKGPET
jgi:hypothetical protein